MAKVPPLQSQVSASSWFGRASDTSVEWSSTQSLFRVLETVRRNGAGSRSEVADLTGLGRGAVAQRISDLVDSGLLTESEVGVSTGGRPPRRVSFRADAGRILVADLGATSIDVALTDLDGNILSHVTKPADIAAGPDAVLDRVDDLFDAMLDASGRSTVAGIGIGIPGPVEYRTGRPVSPPIMPGWDGYPVRERYDERYRAPVWVDNDVNLLAVAEWRVGAAQGCDDVVVIKIGTGIGAGLISRGVVHRGSQGAAGDVGHMQVIDDPAVVCRCGNIGCLEAIAGGAAIARDGEAAARSGRSPWLADKLEREGRVTAEAVTRAATHGDAFCVELLQSVGRQVGLMLASVVNVFNPSVIVVSGGVAAGGGDTLLAAIRETVYRRSLPLATRDLRIVGSGLGPMAGVIGAATVVADELFSVSALPSTLAALGVVEDVAMSRPTASLR